MNFQNYPHPPPPRYNIDVAQKICISRTISLNNIIIQVFRHPKISPSLMKKFHTPQFHHPPPFQKKKKKYLPKPLYFGTYLFFKLSFAALHVKHAYQSQSYLCITCSPAYNTPQYEEKKKKPFLYSYYPSLCGLTGQ